MAPFYILLFLPILIHGQIDLHLICVSTSSNNCNNCKFAAEIVNNMTNFLDGYTLNVGYTYARGQDIGQTFKAFVDNVNSPPVKIGLLGPSFSSQAKVTAEMARYYNLVQSGYTITSPLLSDREKYPYFTRTSVSSALRNQAIMPILKRYNWTHVATIAKQDEFIKPTMDMFIEEDMREEGMTLLAPAVYQFDPNPQIQQLKSADARIIIVYNWFRSDDVSRIECENQATQISELVNSHNYNQLDLVEKQIESAAVNSTFHAYHAGLTGAKYLWIYWWCGLGNLISTLDRDNDGCTMEQRRIAVEGAICIEDATDLRSLLLDYTGDTGMTLEELEEEYNEWQRRTLERNGTNFQRLSRKAFDSAYSLAKALNQTAEYFDLGDFQYDNQTIADRILLELTKLNFVGASGPISYSDIGDRNGRVIVNQIRNMTYHQVASYDPAEGRIVWQEDIWFPGGRPPADVPVQVISFLHQDVLLFVVMTVVSVLGAVFSVICIVFNVIYREMKVIKLSSPRLNTLIAVGCLLSYLAVILTGMDASMVDNNPAICHLRILCLVSAFTFAFGSMFVKTWRVHTLFTNRQMTRKIVKDGHLFAIVGVIWIIDVAILVVWSAADPISWTTRNMTKVTLADEQTIVTPQVIKCDSGYKDVFMAAYYTIKGLMLMFGIFFAWETRKVRVEALNDSKQIGICVYNVMVLSAISVPLVYLLSDNQLNIQFAVIACSVLVCATSTLAFVFVPKMYLIATKGNQVDDSPVLPFAATLHERSMATSQERSATSHSGRPNGVSTAEASTA